MHITIYYDNLVIDKRIKLKMNKEQFSNDCYVTRRLVFMNGAKENGKLRKRYNFNFQLLSAENGLNYQG